MATSHSGRPWSALLAPALCVLALLPFLDKPFHIDDPLFLWSAQQIQRAPLDFYGTTVNWSGYEQPLSVAAKNPPLVSYAIAAVAQVVGFGERALHAVFLLPAAAAVLGTGLLATRLGAPPVLAALALLASPAFLTSASSVMCDVPLLACFVWAVWLWVRGLEERRTASLFAAGVLGAAALLTKYFGLALLPLLALYALWRERRAGIWCLALLPPLAVAAAYQLWTAELYGRGLLFDAADFAVRRRSGDEVGPLSSAVVGLAFLGACGPTLFFAPLFARPRRALALAALALAGLAGGLASLGSLEGHALGAAAGVRGALVAQLSLHVFAGALALGLGIREVVRRPDATSALLLAWLLGTFVFASFLNWTLNARVLLPLLPALAITIGRSLAATGTPRWLQATALLPAAALSLVVARADAQLAEHAREAADSVALRYADRRDSVWFQGHWGFQYYMQAHGFRALDRRHADLEPGDLVVSPQNNVLVLRLPGRLRTIDRIAAENGLVTVMSRSAGAGFYASLFGPLPYVFGGAQPDETWIEEVALRTRLRPE